jgi:G3E family GTPase
VNIDAELIRKGKGEIALKQTEEKLVQLQNGCICCTLREDLLREVHELAKQKMFDYCVIESTGVSEPMQVAETFTFSLDDYDEEAEQNDHHKHKHHHDHDHDHDHDEDNPNTLIEKFILSDVARLDTTVTVVDAVNFYHDIESIQNLKDKYGKDNVADEDDRDIAILLIDQIEFADVILLNKTDLCNERQVKEIETIISKLNPDAKLYKTVKSQVPLNAIINTGLFHFDKAATNAGWLKEVKKGETVGEVEEYGISSFVYRRRKPFHTEKLFELLYQDKFISGGSGIMRSKGFAWICTRPRSCAQWEQSGKLITLSDGGKFFADVEQDVWDSLDEETLAAIEADSVGEYKDRRQEIVFIGRNMDRALIEKTLDSVLIDDADMAKGMKHWEEMCDDSFDAWEEEDDEDEEYEDDDEEEDEDMN